jgi:uncharacterized membrane protein
MTDRAQNRNTATVRVVTSVLVGVVVGVLAAAGGTGGYAPLLGWTAAAATFVGWTLGTIWPMDAATTARHAVRDDASRAAADVVVLGAAVASLAAVALLLTSGSSGSKDVAAGLTLASVALAWAAVHTVFTTRYARLYYSGKPGGIDFNEDTPARYSDFAYLAFTIGMTFQVSDTDLSTTTIRATALRHALLSYLFGVVIVAATINLVAGLGK